MPVQVSRRPSSARPSANPPNSRQTIPVLRGSAFASIDRDRFIRWHAGYTRAVTWIVEPLMHAPVAPVGWLVVDRENLRA
jgi:hypothetical protein